MVTSAAQGNMPLSGHIQLRAYLKTSKDGTSNTLPIYPVTLTPETVVSSGTDEVQVDQSDTNAILSNSKNAPIDEVVPKKKEACAQYRSVPQSEKYVVHNSIRNINTDCLVQ